MPCRKPKTPILSGSCSATSICIFSTKAGISNWRAVSARKALTIDGVSGVRFAVWAPNADARRRRRRFQFLGSPPPSDAGAPQRRHLGTFRAAGRARLALQIRHSRPGRHSIALEGRSRRASDRNATQYRIGRAAARSIIAGATKHGCRRAASGRRRTRRFRSTKFISAPG